MKNRLLFLLIIPIVSFSQHDYRKDTLTCPAFDTTKNPGFNNYSTSKLLDKIEHQDPIEILSAFYYLIKNDHPFNLKEAYSKVIDNESRIKYKIKTSAYKEYGTIIEFSNEEHKTFLKYKPFQVNVFVYFMYKNFKGQLFPNKGHDTKDELRILDSMIINSSKNYLIAHALYDDLQPYDDTYRKKLKSIVDDRKNYTLTELSKALVKIAKFQKEEDVNYIQSFDRVQDAFTYQTVIVLRAILEFPDPKFKPYLEHKLNPLKQTDVPRDYQSNLRMNEGVAILAKLFRKPQFYSPEILEDMLDNSEISDIYKKTFIHQFTNEVVKHYSSEDYKILKKIAITKQYDLSNIFRWEQGLQSFCEFRKHPDFLKLKNEIRDAILSGNIDEKNYPMELFVKMDDKQFQYFYDYLCSDPNQIKNEQLRVNYSTVIEKWKKDEVLNGYQPNEYFNWHYDTTILNPLHNKKIYYETLNFQKLYEDNNLRSRAKKMMFTILEDTSYNPDFNKNYFLSELTMAMNINNDTSSALFDAFMSSDLELGPYHVRDLINCQICDYDKTYKYFYHYLEKIRQTKNSDVIHAYDYLLVEYYDCRSYTNPEVFYKDLFKKVKKFYKTKYKEGVLSKFEYESFQRGFKYRYESAKARGAVFKNFE